MKNRKGDIPISILIIGVILICCIAIFSFFSSTIKVRNSFVGLGIMEEMNQQLEKNSFDGASSEGLYLEKKITTGFWRFKREIILFSAEYKFVP